MATTYSDPEMIRVGTFQTPEGSNDLAQKGGTFYHSTQRKFRKGDPMSVDAKAFPSSTNIRQAEIFREGNDVIYEVMYGVAPNSATLQAVANLLPGDMRKKKFILRKPPVKL